MEDKVVHLTKREIKLHLTNSPKLDRGARLRIYNHINRCDICAKRVCR